MCKWSRFKVGDKVMFFVDGQAMCDRCGGESQKGGFQCTAVYLGHGETKRYGVCDVFSYITPIVCVQCGEKSDM